MRSREKGEELRAAVEEWQDKRNVPQPRLTTGFLDGVQPIVDSYELKVNMPMQAFQPLNRASDASASATHSLISHPYFQSSVPGLAVDSQSHMLHVGDMPNIYPQYPKHVPMTSRIDVGVVINRCWGCHG